MHMLMSNVHVLVPSVCECILSNPFFSAFLFSLFLFVTYQIHFDFVKMNKYYNVIAHTPSLARSLRFLCHFRLQCFFARQYSLSLVLFGIHHLSLAHTHTHTHTHTYKHTHTQTTENKLYSKEQFQLFSLPPLSELIW